MESYFPAEANQYRYDSMMTVDTGASAEGFAPDMGVDPFDDMLPDSSFSSLFPATEPDVAMAQNPLGHHYYSMSSSVQDWQPQWELQQHSRTQSDPGSYISRLNNGQAAFAGGLSAGVPLQDDHRQTIRSASDGQIQGKHFFLGKHRQSKHYFLHTISNHHGVFPEWEPPGISKGRGVDLLTHSLTPSTFLPAARIGGSSTSACALRCSTLSIMTRRRDQCRRSTAKWPRDHVHRYLLPPSENEASDVLSSRGRRRSPSILPPTHC